MRLVRVDGDDLERWPALAVRLYAHRHEVFVRRRGWRALDRGDGLDIDDRDGADGEHLIVAGPAGELLGALRLLPLDAERGLAGFGPIACACADVLAGAATLELTRFFVRKGTAAPGVVRDLLLAGLHHRCRRRDIGRLVAVVDTRLVGHLIRIGLRLTPLSEPRRYAEGSAVAIAIAVEPNGPEPTFLSAGAWVTEMRRSSHRSRAAAMMPPSRSGVRGGHERLLSAGAPE